MGTVKRIERSPFGAMSNGMKRVAAILIACSLALAISLVGIAYSSTQAYASIYPVEKGAQVEKSGAAASGEEAVVIEDDANPMSSGLDKSMAATSAGIPIYWVVVAGIAVVAIFFTVSTRKLNSNIERMNKNVH